jgi:adenosylhomocysteine nucleosidase
MKTTLFIAADAREFRGLLRRLPHVPVNLPVDFARRANRGEDSWLLVANGPGRKLAADAAGAATRQSTVDSIVSTGFCGALDPALHPCDVLLADHVASGGGSFSARLPDTPEPRFTGGLYCHSDVVQSAAEKSQLRARTGAAAVDMESAAVARHAHQAGLPFYCVRVVTDTASEGFVNDFNAARDATGRFHTGRILRNALARPASRLPELYHLHQRCNAASESLGDFLARCQF